MLILNLGTQQLDKPSKAQQQRLISVLSVLSGLKTEAPK